MEQKSVSGQLYDYIKHSYKETTPIFVVDLYNTFPKISRSTVRSIIKRLTASNKLKKLENGAYALFSDKRSDSNNVISTSDLIRYKYLQKDNDIVGYTSGINVANKLGLTSQTASVETIYSNNVANKKRLIMVRKRKLVINAPKVEVTNFNYRLLQILDLLNDFMTYSEYSLQDSAPKIKNYLSDLKLSEDEITKIVDKYPLKAQLNYYRLKNMDVFKKIESIQSDESLFSKSMMIK